MKAPHRRRLGHISQWAGSLVSCGAIVILTATPAILPAQYPPSTSAADISFHPSDVKGFRFDANNSYALLGASVSGVGDVNGDGYEDIVFGAPGPVTPYTINRAVAYLIYGTPAGFAFDSMLIEPELHRDTNADLQPDGISLVWSDSDGLAGACIAGAGDTNGDGFDDFLIGIPKRPFVSYECGAAALVFGSANGIGSGATFQIGPQFEDENGDGFQDGEMILGFQYLGRAGSSMASAGDFNGDGYDDIVLGAPGEFGVGAAYLIFGAPPVTYPVYALGTGLGFEGPFPLHLPLIGNDSNGDLKQDGFYLTGSVPGDTMSVSGAGDINGDGYDDIIVGEPSASTPFFYGSYTAGTNGRAYIIFGIPPTTPLLPMGLPLNSVNCDNNGNNAQDGVIINGMVNGSNLGSRVFGMGDTDGDGFSDAGYSIPTYDHFGALGQIGFVFGSGPLVPPGFGVTSPTAACPSPGMQGHVWGLGDFNADGDTDNAKLVSFTQHFGTSAGPAGDFNGDGLGDVIGSDLVASPGGSPQSGEVFLVESWPDVRFDAGGGIETMAYSSRSFRFRGLAAGTRFGSDVSTAGDFNGDGYHDLLIGAKNEASLFSASGVARLIYGRPQGPALPNAIGKTHTRAGDAPERGIGLIGNGQSMMPVTRCWIDFPSGAGPGGGASLETVTFYRDLSEFSNLGSPKAVAGWEIQTNRVSFFFDVRLSYPESMLGNVAESTLSLYSSANQTGPWFPLGGTFDHERNSIEFLANPIIERYYLLAGSAIDNDLDLKADSCEQSHPSSGITNSLLPDSDGDGFLDGQENSAGCSVGTIYATNPRNADTDADGFPDKLEALNRHIFINGPLVPDAVASIDLDADGMPQAFDPNDLDPDTDNDGYGDLYEYVQRTHPVDATWKPTLGDVTGNGTIDLSDVASIADYNLSLTTLLAPRNADVNTDGIIDLGDVAGLADFNLGLTLLP